MGNIVGFFASSKLIPIVRVDNENSIVPVVEALVNAGMKVIELTMTSPGAVKSLERLVLKHPDVMFGMGSVIRDDDAVSAVKAGAKFIVSPVFRRSVSDVALKYGTGLVLAGFSPTEILQAWESGSDAVKVFPAGVLGTTFIKSILGPMPFLKLIPTGGVNLQNALDYLASGALAVGIGSQLVKPVLVREKKFSEIEKLARVYIERIVIGKHKEGRVV